MNLYYELENVTDKVNKINLGAWTSFEIIGFSSRIQNHGIQFPFTCLENMRIS